MHFATPFVSVDTRLRSLESTPIEIDQRNNKAVDLENHASFRSLIVPCREAFVLHT